MDKLTLAHDYFMKHVNSNEYGRVDDDELISWSWQYADAMFEELEKRKDKSRPAVFEDWQPDWSLAPDWAVWWCIGINGYGMWFEVKPYLDGSEYWCFDSFKKSDVAPSFDYTGDWRDSLRIRPSSK